MPMPILATKLSIPPSRPNVVLRPRLIERLNEGLERKLTLVSAPAGFGKTTLVGAWVSGSKRPVAWLSLDEADNDPIRFLAYLVAALQTIAPRIGAGLVGMLQSAKPPPIESILTNLLDEMTTVPNNSVLVLDDYHVLSATAVVDAVAFLLEHMPPQIHLVIATREDPGLPQARLRVRSQLTELRATDLRFTLAEAARFLKEVMGLSLRPEDIATLESRTEGWVAGLQLAALSLQGHHDATTFIKSFTGSHHFVLDYLLEEVLHRQPPRVQTFLLRTSILDRLCGPLCDAMLLDPSTSGQATLEYLEHANLFIVPLDSDRRWYRYHHLFADLLRQKLHQRTSSSTDHREVPAAVLHSRASTWYEEHSLHLEAFHHAAAANDVERAERLMEGKGMPLHFPGIVAAILGWLHSLPTAVLDARPSLWVKYATTLLTAGQTTGVEQKLVAAEAALEGSEADHKTRNLAGHIAAARATLALTQYQVDDMIAQSRRALEYLHPNNLPFRAVAHCTLGYAYQHRGDFVGASQGFTQAISMSQACGDTFMTIFASIGLGQVQEAENKLHLAADTFRHVLLLAGDQQQQILCEAHLGLARIYYEWNDLGTAEQYGQQSLTLARQYERVIDRFVVCEVFLARLRLAQGDVDGAATLLARTDLAVRQNNFVHRIPDVAAAQVLVLLRQGRVDTAARLARSQKLPISEARAHLAQGDTSAALATLAPSRRAGESKGWADERLKVMILQAVALHAHGDKDKAVHLVSEALALAEPEGFMRCFVDEGPPMQHLLQDVVSRGMASEYTRRLLALCARSGAEQATQSAGVEPLTEREREVLHCIAEGLTNQEIANQLYLSLHTVKVHARNIYGKLAANNRTQAIARAREIGALP